MSGRPRDLDRISVAQNRRADGSVRYRAELVVGYRRNAAGTRVAIKRTLYAATPEAAAARAGELRARWQAEQAGERPKRPRRPARVPSAAPAPPERARAATDPERLDHRGCLDLLLAVVLHSRRFPDAAGVAWLAELRAELASTRQYESLQRRRRAA